MLKQFFLLILLLWMHCASATIVFFNNQEQKYIIEDKITYICDSTFKKTVFEVVPITEWKKLPANSNFGFNNAAFWFKVTIENDSSKDGELVFSVPFPNINFIDFFELTDGKVTKTAHVGEMRSFSDRCIAHRFFLFDSHLHPSQKKTYYFRVYNNGDSLHFPLELYTKNSFISQDYWSILLMGIYLGVILIIIVFNLFYHKLQSRENIYYLLYIFFTIQFFLVIDGYWASIYNGRFLYWQEISTIVYAIVANFSFLRFTRYFLNISKESKGILFVYRLFEICLLVLFVLVFFGYPVLLIPIIGVTVLSGCSFVLNFTVSIVRYKQKFEQARYFIIAYSIGTLGVLAYVMRDLNLIADTVFVSSLVKFTFLIEVIVLWLAVLHRFKREQRIASGLLVAQQTQIQKQNEALEVVNKELEKLSIVASETDNSVAIFSPEGNLEWVNLGFEKIHGHSLRRLQKQQTTTIASIYNNAQLPEMLKIGLQRQEAIIFESSIDNGAQKKLWITTTITPYFDKQGQLQKIIAIDADISLLKQMNEELNRAKERAEESSRLKTNFLSNVSHELRTPLNSIIGFSQLLLNREYSSEKQKEFLKLINSHGSHLLELICDILDVARIESGSYNNQPIHFNINLLLKEMHNNFDMQLQNLKRQSIKCELQCSLPDSRATVYIDQLKLKQVIINILGNAMKFTNSGSITLGYIPMKTDQGMMLEFWIEDTGVGIPADKLDVVFQRFRQADDTQTRLFNGAGLGLTISKGLIEIMGGTIAIQSQEGKGTRVSFALPFSETPQVAMVVEAEDDIYSSLSLIGQKILIVEDEYSNYEVLYETLVDTGAEFLHATTGQKALTLYERSISVVLLDVRLPDMSGIEVARRLLEVDPKVKIIFQTAYALRETKDECLAMGAIDFFTKPIDPHRIIESLRTHLKK